ncbi:MAG: hypothetical protein HKN20_11390 [Gemmatimonadetes bacterium]|nr:hypothetical protein [Gemmatimonadota bacterium]
MATAPDGNSRLFLVGSCLITALLFFGLRPIFFAKSGGAWTASLAFGLIACLGVISASFFLSRWALRASNQAFILAFGGGVLARLFLLAGFIFVAYGVPGLDERATAIAILAAFFPLTFLEVFCVVRGARKRGNANETTTDRP